MSASRLLKNVDIRARVAELTAPALAETGATVERVLEELTCLAFYDVTQILESDDDGLTMKDPRTLPDGNIPATTLSSTPPATLSENSTLTMSPNVIEIMRVATVHSGDVIFRRGGDLSWYPDTDFFERSTETGQDQMSDIHKCTQLHFMRSSLWRAGFAEAFEEPFQILVLNACRRGLGELDRERQHHPLIVKCVMSAD